MGCGGHREHSETVTKLNIEQRCQIWCTYLKQNPSLRQHYSGTSMEGGAACTKTWLGMVPWCSIAVLPQLSDENCGGPVFGMSAVLYKKGPTLILLNGMHPSHSVTINLFDFMLAKWSALEAFRQPVISGDGGA